MARRSGGPPIGVDKPGTETPGGRFYVRELLRVRVRERGSLYVRVRNRAIRRLGKLMPIGTPVRIR